MDFRIRYSWKNIYALFVGLLTGIQIRLIGMVSLSEIIIIPSVFFLIYKLNFYIKNKYYKRVLILSLVWLASAILSDLFNQSSPTNTLKGIGYISIFIFCLIFSYWLLYDNIYRIKYFLIGYVVSNLIKLFIFPSGSLEDTLQETNNLEEFYVVWFTYYIYPLILFIVLILYSRYRVITILFVFLIGVYALFSLSRSLFLIHTLVSVFLLYIGEVRDDNKLYKYKRINNHILRNIIILICSLVVVKECYEYSASRGILGESAYNKYVAQKEKSEIGLLSGRKEFFIALYAIKNSPLLGFGSYALDKKGYGKQFLLEYDPTNIYIHKFGSDSLIPSHSYIMGAWVYHGILGALFWVYIIYLLLLFIIKYSLFDKKIIAYMFLMIFTFLWDIFFSPGWGVRTYVALQISLVVMCLKNEYK